MEPPPPQKVTRFNRGDIVACKRPDGKIEYREVLEVDEHGAIVRSCEPGSEASLATVYTIPDADTTDTIPKLHKGDLVVIEQNFVISCGPGGCTNSGRVDLMEVLQTNSEGEVTHICRPGNPDGEKPNADNELPNDRGVRLYRVPPQTREAVEESVNSLMASADSFAVGMPLNDWTEALKNIRKITGNGD